ncbi:lipoprotein 17-related variable surface protein [Mycoplasmopsis primatum]|uniref:lipoprotein 17-related variable surface protein n=1 Tax=Mycoplasmopsis primatum TaxID=55604 RepID=UPI000496EFFF|nr:lipoprotein 17-related variable surface protein [Mycoplasmopsis primatum]
MQGNRLKKSLIFALPAVLITTTAPLASISCGGGDKYSYLNDITFKLINPSITTNKEIVDEFKKNKQSIKKYLEISNPKKYDLQINDVEIVGNSSIKILIKTSQNGKNEYNAWTQPLSGLKDPSKKWEQKELEWLSKVLLDQVKNNPKDLIDWQSSTVKDKFPYDINAGMIHFKSSITELIAKKSPKVELVANIDSNSKDDAKGALSLSLELKTKNNKPHKISKNNITLSTDDGLLSLDDLTSKLTIDDLDLPEDIKDKLPSKFEDDIVLKKDSDFKKKYPNVKLIRVSDPVNENDDVNGIKNVSLKLEYKNKKSSKVANLSINKFYSTKQFDELCDSLTLNDLDINIDSYLLPSNYNVSSIKLKKDSPLLLKNPNLTITTKDITKDYQEGNLDLEITLNDKANGLIYTKKITISGFFNINKFSENDLEIINKDPLLLPSSYDIKEIRLKRDSQLSLKNPNLTIKTELNSADNENGFLSVNITLNDDKNKYTAIKKLTISGFYSSNKFKQQIESLSENDLKILPKELFPPRHYNADLIKLKEDSPLLLKNPNIIIKKIIKENDADAYRGVLTINVFLSDSKNKILEHNKKLKISGFVKEIWTVQELDELIDKLLSIPLIEGQYINVVQFSQKYRDLPERYSDLALEHNFSLGGNYKHIVKSRLKAPYLRVKSTDSSVGVKVWWNIQGKRTLTDAQKILYRLVHRGPKKATYSTKIFPIYVIKTGEKTCDVDVKAEEAN